MTRHEQTIEEHVRGNLAVAIDQSHEYDDPGMAFGQNTYDSCLEDGYTEDEAFDAKLWFIALWEGGER